MNYEKRTGDNILNYSKYLKKKTLQCIAKISSNYMKKQASGVILILKCNYRVKECMRKGIKDIHPNIDRGSWLSLKEHVLRGNIDYKTMFEKENIPCTSKLCRWNTVRKIKMPLKAVERQYKCTKKTSTKPLVQFNPCLLEKRPTEQEKVDSVNKLLSYLRYKAAQSSTNRRSAWEVLLETRCDNYALDNKLIIILAAQVKEF